MTLKGKVRQPGGEGEDRAAGSATSGGSPRWTTSSRFYARSREAQYYDVKSGDTLSKIAKQFYGDANQYNCILEANRPMLKDADHIYPGQKLRIPALATAGAGPEPAAGLRAPAAPLRHFEPATFIGTNRASETSCRRRPGAPARSPRRSRRSR